MSQSYMSQRTTLSAAKQQVWRDYFGEYDYHEIMSLRSAYNEGYRTNQSRAACAIYVRFWRKVREAETETESESAKPSIETNNQAKTNQSNLKHFFKRQAR